MNPKFISLHYTAKCLNNCKDCYLIQQRKECEEIKEEEWLNLPAIAKDMGIEKIAIAINLLSPDKVVNFLDKFFSECCKYKILLDITTLSEMARNILSKMCVDSLDILSISLNEERILDKGLLDIAFKTSEKAHKSGVRKTSVSYLIRSANEDFSLLENLLTEFDTVHLLFEKPLSYTKDEYYSIIEKLYTHGIFQDERYIIDPCILFRLGLVGKCHSCNYIIDINPYGSVSGCAFNHKKPIGTIKEMGDLSALIRSVNSPIISNCKHLEFRYNNEIN